MKYKILLTSAIIFSAAIASAQNANKAFAITSDGNQDFLWMNIRQIDLGSGQVTKTIFQRGKTDYVLTDVNTKVETKQSAAPEGNIFMTKDYPTGSMVAAAAYDIRNNKLFFTPMRIAELRWIDLDNKNEISRFYSMTSDALSFGNAVSTIDEANNITRMVIAADGNGYAVTNDGNHFIRFTTGKKPVITDLGNLIDNEKTNAVSIHNKCSSWGGDMLADAFGKLYIISANRNVFSIDIDSRITTHLGVITGLPANYTTNAAAVDADGNIVVNSANVFEGYYKLKLSDLAATPIEGSEKHYNASDLANANFLLQKEADATKQFSLSAPSFTENTFSNSDKRVFPNPVTSSTFAVMFDGYKAGNYSITLTDISGRILQTQKVNVTKAAQTEKINLLRRPTNGIYLVKVYDENKQIVFTEKVMVQ